MAEEIRNQCTLKRRTMSDAFDATNKQISIN